MEFQPDWRIDGEKYQYAIVRKLGEGGFGITYLAKRSDGKRVVIKTLNDEMQKIKNDREFNELQQKFIKEALLLRGLNHHHIVKVLDICHSANLQCMVMEYIDGGSLYDRIDKQGVLSEEDALRYIKQIGSALEYMHDPTQHEDPILHRDLKPENIMLRRKPDEAILIDFGIAREFTPNKTATHTAFGSRGFRPIEQIDRRRKRGAYTDVYGLAAILYYALTKKNPPDVLLIKGGIEELVPPRQHNANVSESVSKAILWGMKLEPKDRPETVQKWLKKLNKRPQTMEQWLENLYIAKPAEPPKTILYQDVAKPVKPSEPIKTIPYRDVAKPIKPSEPIKTIPYRNVAKPAKQSEHPKKIPYQALAISGFMYAINTFCLVFFHVLTWQLAKEMAVLFLLPFAASLDVKISRKNRNSYKFSIFFVLFITGIAFLIVHGYSLGGTNLAGAWILAGIGTCIWLLVEVGAMTGAAVAMAGAAVALTVAGVFAWFLALNVALAVAVAVAVCGAMTGAIAVALSEEQKPLEKLEPVCLLLSATTLGIPFVFAIIDMNEKSFSEQKMFQITMGTIVLGLIVGGGLGLLTRLVMGR